MKEDFANYSQSLSLKELGFDEPCFGYFNGKEIYRLGGDSTLSIDKISMYRNTYLSFKDENLVIPNEEDWINHPNTIRRLRGIQVSAPLKQQVFKWFREKYKIFGDIHSAPSLVEGVLNYSFSITTINELESSSHPSYFSYSYFLRHHEHTHNKCHYLRFDTYEEADSACIDKLIELVKNKTL